ncbi:MAG: helix-turn-helix domain-containing protein [Lactobacillus sp.]|jgi:transcriptional regulator with XRE-family HTH domain|nr:helix-turn-helix domain-containing protein [Lactobacillus sp.]
MPRIQPIDNIYLSIGQKIKSARMEKKIKIKDLADKLGITYQQLQKHEKGVNRLTICRLIEIAHALDVPIEYFIDNKLTIPMGDDYDLKIAACLTHIKNRDIKRHFYKLCLSLENVT